MILLIITIFGIVQAYCEFNVGSADWAPAEPLPPHVRIFCNFTEVCLCLCMTMTVTNQLPYTYHNQRTAAGKNQALQESGTESGSRLSGPADVGILGLIS
ncbi:hypothetical protein V6000_003556 [Aspergillus fumigatus]|jgi:D-alanyl-lipoteichoic acid acyltransferase DltB (MBOAT superfamily)